MSEHYENLEKAMCKELEKLDKKYTADTEMTDVDAERADKLYHALKSAATYHAMKDAEEWDEDEEGGHSEGRYGRGRMYRGGSYARGRDRRGRFTSYGMDADGYSGHYPMEYIDPMYYNRRY